MATPFTIQVTLFIKPEYREKYLEALRDFLPRVRQEPVCNFLYAHEAADEPGTIILLEQFRDQDEYNQVAHERDYVKRYFQLGEEMFAKPRVIQRLNPIGPEESTS